MAVMDSIHDSLVGERREPEYFNDASAFIFIGGLWLGWSLWLALVHKSAGMIAGLVITGLFLVWLTIRCARRMVMGFFVCVVTALAIPAGLVFFFVRILLLLLSPICVTGGAPYLKRVVKGDYCRLCEKCEGIVDRSRLLRGSPWIPTWSFENHEFYSQADLVKSKNGCHFCKLVFGSVKTFKPLEETQDSNVGQAKTTLKIWMRRHIGDSPELYIQLLGPSILESWSLKVKWQDQSEVTHTCIDSLYSDSMDTAEWANDRIAKCLEHPLCQTDFIPSAQKEYLPLRLIDISEAANGVVRLVSTAHLDIPSIISYCALSHCWGGTVSTILTREDLHKQKSMDIHSLPKSFRDAVTITSQLDCRYLWIDSLCIVQDDPEEWQVQSTKMGLVYTNAKCVISAAASPDSSGGCFKERILDWNDCLLYRAGNKVLALKTARNAPDLRSVFEHFVDGAPLATRAWAFQERYLASRALHYANGVVLFECNTLIASAHDRAEQAHAIKGAITADGKLHAPDDVLLVEKPEAKWTPPPPNFDKILLAKHRQAARNGWKRRRKVRPEYLAQQEKFAMLRKASARAGTRGAFEFLWRFRGETVVERIEFHNSWFELVGRYSVRRLTFATDKAMAIAGIAACIQQTAELKYAAGLWMEMLPFDLLWTTSQDSVGKRPTRSVPSWSWTAVDGQIVNPLSVGQENVGGSYGYMRQLTNRSLFRSHWAAVKPHISCEALVNESAVNGLVHTAILQLRGYLCKLDVARMSIKFDTSEGLEHEELSCLPVLSFRNKTSPLKTSETQLHGIILRRKIGCEERYERVGYFCTIDERFIPGGMAFQGGESVIEIE